MAVTNEQKIDFLLKKIGFTKTKTGSVVGTGAISGTPKQPFAEAIPSPLIIANGALWNESDSIPTTPPGSDTAQVKVYLAATSGLRMTADATSSNQRAYIAYSTYNDTSSTRLTNWIDTQFGSAYLIKVYKGDPNSGGVALSAAGSGANDGWFFDYSAGVLNFNDTSVPSGVTDTNIYIVGYRYIGLTGAPTPTGGGNFTFNDLVVSRNFSVGGLSTFTGNIDANGIIEGIAGENKIPSLYANLGALPSAVTYHGMFAHVHSTGRGYFAHAGNWLELVNKETNGVVGTGTEAYNIGNINAVDGVFSGNVSIGGTLTYEDVKNVDAVGLITARSGIRVTGGVIEAQAGENKIPSLYSNMGALPSAGTYHGMFAHVHATGRGYFAHAGNWLELVNKEINGVVGTGTEHYNVGIVTASSFSGDGDFFDLDVDGHTNLDNVSIAGVTTAVGTLRVGTGHTFHDNGNAQIAGITTISGTDLIVKPPTVSSSRIKLGYNEQMKISVSSANQNVIQSTAAYLQIASNNINLSRQDTNLHMARFLAGQQCKLTYNYIDRIATSGVGATVYGQFDTTNLNIAGVSTFTGNIDANGDLDVDGHTNLDNVSIAGVTSVASLTSGRVVTAGTGGKLQDSNNLTFDGTNLFVSGINVTGGGATSILGADIVTRNLKATGLSTFVGQSEFDGNAKFDSTITAGGSTGSNGQYLKTTGSGVEWATFPTLRTRQTFTASSGQTTFSFSYTINFIDVFVNGIKLTDAEFTATNGSTVVLAVGCFVGDIVELVSYNTVSGGGGGGGGGGISNVVEDTTPQLGGNLDLFNKSITGTGNVNITGIISATSFKGPSGVTATFIGDGSGLTGITASGSGVVVKDDNNVVGTAGTINFAENLSVTPASAGIVTVGVDTSQFNFNRCNISGIATFVGVTTHKNDVHFGGTNSEVWFWGNVNPDQNYMAWKSWVAGGKGGLYIPSSNIYFGGSKTQFEPHGSPGGASSHFKIKQYSSASQLNPLRIESDYTYFTGSPGNTGRDIARFEYAEGASLYYTGTKRLQTSGVGVTVTGSLDVSDIRSDALTLKNAAGSASYAVFSNGGSALLKHNNTDRLETSASGVTVTGTVAATSYTGDGSQLTGIGAASTSNIITNNLQVLGISTFQGHVQTGTGATVGIGSTAYVHKIAFAEAGSVNNTLTAALGNSGGSLTFTGGGVQNGVWGNNGLKIAGNGASTTTGPEANCTLEVVSSQNTRVLFKGSANTGLDFDSSSPNNGVANYIRSDKNLIFYTGYGSAAGVTTNFEIGKKEGSTFYSSVGIRTNYYPLGAVSISMDAISGIVTATKFVGDGSQLTNLPGGGSYGNNDVDNHLNVSGASSGQILSWNGSDYAWVNDQTGGGGGGTDVGITTNLSGSFTASAGTPATINTFAYHDNDKVVEYTVYIKNGSDFQSQKLLAMRDGTTIHSTQFAVMFSSSLLVQCDATISSGNILLRATPETGVSGSTTYKIKREVM